MSFRLVGWVEALRIASGLQEDRSEKCKVNNVVNIISSFITPQTLQPLLSAQSVFVAPQPVLPPVQVDEPQLVVTEPEPGNPDSGNDRDMPVPAEECGMKITQLLPEGPAAAASMQVGDIILQVGDQRVELSKN